MGALSIGLQWAIRITGLAQLAMGLAFWTGNLATAQPGRLSQPGQAGQPLWASHFLYSLGRLWVGCFRLDPRVAFGLGLAQLIGAATLPLALLGWWLSRRALRRRVRRP